MVSPEDAASLCSYCYEMGSTIQRDQDILGTTKTLRDGNEKALGLLYQRTQMEGKYPALAAGLDALLMGELGSQVQPLSPELRSKAVSAFMALAYAFQERSHAQ